MLVEIQETPTIQATTKLCDKSGDHSDSGQQCSNSIVCSGSLSPTCQPRHAYVPELGCTAGSMTLHGATLRSARLCCGETQPAAPAIGQSQDLMLPPIGRPNQLIEPFRQRHEYMNHILKQLGPR